MNFRYVIVVVGIFLLLVGGARWYTSQTESDLYPFELVAAETVASWDFKGVYSGNHELEKKAQADIVRLNGMFGTEGNTDYILYVSIAGQYNLLGDGAKEYEYLLRALAIDSKKTGLAWYNLGVLLARLGAFESARIAYEHAVQAQPDPQYVTAYLEFLTKNFANDEESIEKEFRYAAELFGAYATLSEIRARWLEKVGRTEEAIAEWRKVSELSPGSTSAIDVELQRLESKL